MNFAASSGHVRFVADQVIEYKDTSGASKGLDGVLRQDEAAGAKEISAASLGDRSLADAKDGRTAGIDGQGTKYTVAFQVGRHIAVIQATGKHGEITQADAEGIAASAIKLMVADSDAPIDRPHSSPTPDATAAANVKAAVDHLGAANSFVEAHNWPAALKEYDAAYALDPNNRDVVAGRTAARATATAVAPTATPDHAVAIRSYFTMVAPIATDYGTAMSTFSEQNSQLTRQPSLFLSSAWKIRAATSLAILENDANKLAAVDAPAELAAMHASFATLASETHAMAADYSAGIDNIDAARLRSATRHLQAITRLTADLTHELDSVKRQYSLR